MNDSFRTYSLISSQKMIFDICFLKFVSSFQIKIDFQFNNQNQKMQDFFEIGFLK